MKINTLTLAAALVGSLCLPSAAWAQIAPGFNDHRLPATDDGSSPETALPFAINFYGNAYNSVFVNNNGNLTFGAASNTFTPTGLGAGYTGQSIIAPFFADVDTRGTGLVTYGAGTYNGFAAFGATWNGVGYYDTQTDKLDTFQALLIDRSDLGSGNFDIVFNYGSINWDTGDGSGGTNGLLTDPNGTSAAAGFNAGTGQPGSFFQVPGSLQPGAFIDGGPNALSSAQKLSFTVRDGVIAPTPGPVPEPASWALMITGFGLAGAAMRRRRKVTTTVACAV